MNKSSLGPHLSDDNILRTTNMMGMDNKALGNSALNAFDDWFDSLDQNDTFESRRHVQIVDNIEVDDSDSDDSSEDEGLRKKKKKIDPLTAKRNVASPGVLERMMMQDKAATQPKTVAMSRSGSTGRLREMDGTKKRGLTLFGKKKSSQVGTARQTNRDSVTTTLAALLDGEELLASPIQHPRRSNSVPMEQAASSTNGKKVRSVSHSPKPRKGGQKNGSGASETPTKRKGKKKVKSNSSDDSNGIILGTTLKTPKKKAAKKKQGGEDGVVAIAGEATPTKKKKWKSLVEKNSDAVVDEAMPTTKKKKKKAKVVTASEKSADQDIGGENSTAATEQTEDTNNSASSEKQLQTTTTSSASEEFVPPAPISFRAEIVAADHAMMASKAEIKYHPDVPKPPMRGKKPKRQDFIGSTTDKKEEGDVENDGDDDNRYGTKSSGFIPPAPISYRADIVAADQAMMASKPEIHYNPEPVVKSTPKKRWKKLNRSGSTSTEGTQELDDIQEDNIEEKEAPSTTSYGDGGSIDGDKDSSASREKNLARWQALERAKEKDLEERERQIRERELELERKLKHLEKSDRSNDSSDRNKSTGGGSSSGGRAGMNRRRSNEKDGGSQRSLAQSDHGVASRRRSNERTTVPAVRRRFSVDKDVGGSQTSLAHSDHGLPHDRERRHGRMRDSTPSTPSGRRRPDNTRREMMRMEDSSTSMLSQSDHGVVASSSNSRPSMVRGRSEAGSRQTKWSSPRAGRRRGEGEDPLAQSDHALAGSNPRLNIPWRPRGQGGGDDDMSQVSQSEHGQPRLTLNLSQDSEDKNESKHKIWSTRAFLGATASSDDDDDDDVSISDSEVLDNKKETKTEPSSRGRGRSASQNAKAPGDKSLSVSRKGRRTGDEAGGKQSEGTSSRPPVTAKTPVRKNRRSVSRGRIERKRSGDDLNLFDGDTPDSIEILSSGICPASPVKGDGESQPPAVAKTPIGVRRSASTGRAGGRRASLEQDSGEDKTPKTPRTPSTRRAHLIRASSADRDGPITEIDTTKSPGTPGTSRMRPPLARTSSSDPGIPITEISVDNSRQSRRSASTGRFAGRRGSGAPQKRNVSLGARTASAPRLRPTMVRDNSSGRSRRITNASGSSERGGRSRTADDEIRRRRSTSAGVLRREHGRRRTRKDEISNHLRNALGGGDEVEIEPSSTETK